MISVGNLVVGGSGKTPAVAALATLLADSGERPVILSRGYGRRRRTADVVIVSDGAGAIAPVEESGDEPQMLARMLPRIPVVVASRRYDAGLTAEAQLSPTVLLLDDGFQHLDLARDIDLLLMSPDDLHEQVLPGGRLRERLTAAGDADALVVAGTEDDARRLASATGVSRTFTLVAHVAGPVPVRGRQVWPSAAAGAGAAAATSDAGPAGDSLRRLPVAAVAGIARPERFITALKNAGWNVADQHLFRDHHWFDARDIERVEREASSRGAQAIVTTEKDAVRLAALTLSMPWYYLPLRVSIAPAEDFGQWLRQRLAAARSDRHASEAAGGGTR